MENNSNKRRELGETVTLVLKEERFVVEKQKLMDKCQYFAALWSAHFIEHGQTEHVINYKISSISLQDFIDWIHNDKITFSSATSYDFKELDRLLILLELSVLFGADKLKGDITDRLTERHFMSPKYTIKIWLLAQELNINVLRDLSLDVCLDRFNELPRNLICELSREHFLKLIGNINVRATKSYLHQITREWMNHHDDFTVPLDIIENKKPNILYGIISCEDNNGEQYIHCWDGNDFFELTSFEYPPNVIEHCSITGKSLEGMQITVRRYDLYFCGGEYGIGSGIFNRKVWRYSLISKKWILETVMPVKRRDMITVFLKNTLYLVGGMGQHEKALNTIDIYNIYTGMWTSSYAMVPVDFTRDFEEHFIFSDTLIIYQLPYVHIYFPDEDVWKTRLARDICELDFNSVSHIPIVALQTMSCYIDVVDRDKMVLKAVTETCNVEGCNNIIKNREKENRNIDGYSFFPTPFFLTPFFREHDEIMKLKPAVLLHADGTVRNRTLHLHSIPIRDPRKFRFLFFTKKNSARRFFNLNLLHPAHLHTTNLDHI